MKNRQDAGTTDMGLNADDFENTNNNFANVTFKVTDGYMTVNKVDAVIKTAPATKDKLIYNGLEQELIVKGQAEGGTLLYAIGYKPYYSVKSKIKLGNFNGKANVKLVKNKTGETFELKNVSPSDISFKGVPKGKYKMTITWTDDAKNTLTTTFEIN